MTIRPSYIALAGLGTSLGMLLAAALLLVQQRRQLVAFDCGRASDPELIVQSGPEFILANPSVTEATNTFLVSAELSDPSALPARWRFQDSRVLRADAHGLELRASGEVGDANVRFHSATGEWTSRSSANAEPQRVRCRRLAALPATVSRFNGVPLEYLSLRPWPLALFNPDLSEAGLRLTLARLISGRSGSDYSYYKLVSLLPRSLLSAADDERLQGARKALLSELSSNDSFWEYSGQNTAGWDFANEQSEAEAHADRWCREHSQGSLAGRLSQGWQLVASVPQSLESGKQRQLYSDGRFMGYVDYTASCQGTQHTLRKDADLSRLP